ncbi:MAG: DUF3987 domain-containing protein [Sulfuricaulis sp.]|nr:DUF3987 domain-containing protein [Sulfuricaulis sp.]
MIGTRTPADFAGMTGQDVAAWAKTRRTDGELQVIDYTPAKWQALTAPGASAPEPVPEAQPEPEAPRTPQIETEDDADPAEEFLRSTERDAVMPDPPTGSLDEPISVAPERSTIWTPPDQPWFTPLDFWEGTSLPEVDPRWIPAPIAPYLLDAADARGIDPAQVVAQGPTVCAGLIRESIVLHMSEGGWRERTRLWCANVGEPSMRKGAGDDICQDFMKGLALAARAEHEAALKGYRRDHAVYEQEMAAFVRGKAKGEQGKEPPEPERPASTRLWTEDITIQGMALQLANHSRGKIILSRDELAGWFGTFDAYRNSAGVGGQDRPVWLSAYEGKERWIDRAENGGTAIHVPSWSVCVVGGIQPSILAQIAAKLGHDGMLQRFQIAISGPPHKESKRPISPAAVARWERVQRGLLAMIYAEEHGQIRLSPEADAFRSECSDWLLRAQQSGLSPALSAAIGKWDGLLGRLALTWHCIHAADEGRAWPERVVPLSTVEAVWAYMQGFLWPHAMQFYEAVLGDGESRRANTELAGRILAHGITELTTTWLHRRWQRWRQLRQPHQKREVLEGLALSGWLQPVAMPGQMSTRWRVNPAVHDGRFEVQRERYAAEIARLAALKRGNMREPGTD